MTTRDFQNRSPLSILFAYFKPHRGLFILDLVCATIVALIDLAFCRTRNIRRFSSSWR